MEKVMLNQDEVEKIAFLLKTIEGDSEAKKLSHKMYVIADGMCSDDHIDSDGISTALVHG